MTFFFYKSLEIIFLKFVQNLPRNIRLELDPEVNEQIKSDNRKLAYFKEHKGKFYHKSEIPKKIEETINTILSGKSLVLKIRSLVFL